MASSPYSFPESAPPVAYLSRKALPIKHNDAEPLTRDDVQYDLLDHIFSDNHPVFTSPRAHGKSKKITFSDLYISALYDSQKCSKVLKDKMKETPAFATELAKISLLTNVGRINTTMAFFPEMKTALRTYHPVPSLQKTDGNAQDAPRIKNCLKAALLLSESNATPPSTPEEILVKLRSGEHPPTSIVNLIFVLANHAAPLAEVHFDGVLNFLDLFLPNGLFFSADRARVFLWLVYYYLENPATGNPFDDDFSRKFRSKAPKMRQMTESQALLENVDTADEIAWGKKMSNQRNVFLKKLVNSLDQEKKPKPSVHQFVGESGATDRHQRARVSSHETSPQDGPFMYYVPNTDSSRRTSKRSIRLNYLSKFLLIPPPSLPYPTAQPRSRPSVRPPLSRSISPAVYPEKRSMLHCAWTVANAVDPLADSDGDTDKADEYLWQDYTRRRDVLTRIVNSAIFRRPIA